MTPLGWLYGASVAWKAASARPYRAEADVIEKHDPVIGGEVGSDLAPHRLVQAVAVGEDHGRSVELAHLGDVVSFEDVHPRRLAQLSHRV